MLHTDNTTISLSEEQSMENLRSKAPTLADLVTKQIRESIIVGNLLPGQRLKEDELCRKFGISRPPIREAFKTLGAQGLLVHIPRRGVFVAEYSAKDVEEVYTLISMLYNKTTDLAIDVMTDQDIENLKACLNRMVKAVESMVKAIESSPYDIREYQLAHGDFHQTIIDRAGNGRIRSLERELRDQIAIFSYTSFQVKDHLKASLDYHTRIFDAIRKKDREAALRLMEEHVVKATAFLVTKLKSLANEGSATALVE